ncbi:TonB-dependent receptor plug [Fibrella aestuarina BUZ 2]|uniref:TonB-dependent receptor plug n=1 Tax=Fibrella aestuarina BUZ 2 TaxID=1166018 RepID=I0KB23_9BACT|nr:carboxypeptidase-like regulatory domain-containing protein [Fibrella aestuarina]CCH01326.1 TonB-dependent receptor plug [Fibrella aestuarina BUZ 2]
MTTLRWLLCLCCLPVFTQAQPAQRATLTGKITNATTGEPLPFASVYINSTTRGTNTDEKGLFTLPDVPFGTTELVVSYTGFTAERKTIDVKEVRPRLLEITLFPMTNLLSDVVVKAGKDRQWEGQLDRFKRDLLGTSPFAGKCTITNPEVLSFSESNGTLTATASAPLVIDNRALGFRMQYTLLGFRSQNQTGRVVFGGTTLFSELQPDSPRQAATWQRNREVAYRGSLRHLLASLAAGTHEKEGFLVYQTNPDRPLPENPPPTLGTELGRHLKPIELSTLVLPGAQPHERWLVSMSPLEVFYTRYNPRNSPYRDAPYAFSKLVLPQKTLGFTTAGAITAPRGFDAVGYLSDDRLAAALPDDWQRPVEPRRDSVAASTPLPTADKATHGGPAVLLHIDKPLYLTGDRLSLSGYVLDGRSRQIDTAAVGPALSVAIWSDRQTLVQHQWLPVREGRTVGTFRLSDTLATGTYWLRAYTGANRQQPAFERPILVVNGTQPNVPGNPPPTSQPDRRRWIVNAVAPPKRIVATATLGTATSEPTRSLSIALQDDQGRSVFARLSVAVTDADGIPPDSLGPDFFAQLALANKQPLSANAVKPDITLHGTVISSEKPPYNVTFFATGGAAVQMRVAQTDQTGAFTVEQLDLPDTTQAVVRVANRRGKPIEARVSFRAQAESPGTLPVLPDAARYFTQWRSMIEAGWQRQQADPAAYRQAEARQLNEVAVRARRSFDDRPADVQLRSLHDRVDQTIVLTDDSPDVANLYLLIQAKVPSVRVEQVLANGRVSYSVKFPGTWSILNAAVPVQTGFGAPPPPKTTVEATMQNPLFLMDGFPIDDTDGTQLLAFSPANIERIEVLKSGSVAAIYGANAARGVLAFYSKTTREGASVKGVSRHTLRGYANPTAPSTWTNVPGVRRDVLAWLPLATTDAFGQLTIPIEVAPAVRTLRLTLQGVTDAGLPVSCVQTLSVGGSH